MNRKLLRSELSKIAAWDNEVANMIVETGKVDYLKTRSIEAVKKGDLQLAVFLLGVAIVKQNTECPLDPEIIKRDEGLEVARLQAEYSAANKPDGDEKDLGNALENARKILKCKHKLQRIDGKWTCSKCKVKYAD